MDVNGTTERWVKYHVRSLRAGSTLRQISRADRATFLDYVALARWQAPFRGCLCDEDGTPWGRKRCAELVGENYGAIKRTEEALVAAGLITLQRGGVYHKDSRGRVHITHYDHYQGRLSGEETSVDEGYGIVAPEAREMKAENAEARETKAEGYEILALKAREMKAATFSPEGYENEGQQPETPTGATGSSDATFSPEGYENEGRPSVVVQKYRSTEEVVVQDAASFLVDEARQVLETLLEQEGGSATIDAAIMAACRVHPRASEVLVQECGALAARAAQGEKVSLGYLPSNVRQAAERLAEEEALLDGDERMFVRLRGPVPRENWLAVRRWREELNDFRADREHYLWRQCRDGLNPALRERARKLGLWDDELPERAVERLLASPAEGEDA